jgi:methylthioribose-1-phosphate isomerase
MLEPERIIRLEDGCVVVLDQRRLRDEEVELVCRSSTEAAEEVTARFVARNPAFDVTPAELISAIVTEHAVHHAPYAESLAGAVAL